MRTPKTNVTIKQPHQHRCAANHRIYGSFEKDVEKDHLGTLHEWYARQSKLSKYGNQKNHN